MSVHNLKDEPELPEEIDITLYVNVQVDSQWDHNVGEVTIEPWDRTNWTHNEDRYICIGQHEVTVPMPKVEIDFATQRVKYLKEKIKKEKADHEVKMNYLQGEIDKLLAIEHKPED